MKRTLATAFLCLLLATPAWAGIQEGAEAYLRGDYATALREFRSLAEQGDARSMSWLGIMYREGRGVPQDYVQAHKWFNLAKTQRGSNRYFFDVVAEKMTPAQVAEAQKQAREWWVKHGEQPKKLFKAAEQGNSGALHLLGSMYREGRGVPQDYVQAHKWFNLAATKGDKDAVKNRDDVAKKMTPADISKAQKLAREWWAAFQKRKGK